MKTLPRILLIVAVLLLSGCSILPIGRESEAPQPTATTPAALETSAPSEAPTSSGPVTLLIWLPPEFDPANGSPEGEILQARLDAFAVNHPGVRVDVRIKALDGPTSLLESLSAASAAAPLALPDLIALPAEQLQVAIGRNLIFPMDTYLTELSSEGWYDFALSLGTYEGKRYGLAFAGDALIMAYRPETIEEPPLDWDSVIETRVVLSFPAAETNALFTLAQYLALGGLLKDEAGRPTIDTTLLTDVFEFYRQAEEVGVMPFWLTRYTDGDTPWEEFLSRQAPMTITWATNLMASSSDRIQGTTIPTPDGTPFTLATGWVWALAGNDPGRYQIAVALAEFLTQDEFVSAWTLEANFLPTRPGALALWPVGPNLALASQVLPSAIAIPDKATLDLFGEYISQGVISVLKRETTPADAAQAVLEGIGD